MVCPLLLPPHFFLHFLSVLLHIWASAFGMEQVVRAKERCDITAETLLRVLQLRDDFPIIGRGYLLSFAFEVGVLHG